jgi:two-component system phosphate regulon sensor histidine kinase PhoR
MSTPRWELLSGSSRQPRQPPARWMAAKAGTVPASCTRCSSPFTNCDVRNDTFFYAVPSPQHVTVDVLYPDSGRQFTLVDDFRTPGSYQVKLPYDSGTAIGLALRFRGDSGTAVSRYVVAADQEVIRLPLGGAARVRLVERIVDNLSAAEWEPIEGRIKPDGLDSTIGAALKESGIDLSYAFGVITRPNDSLPIVRPSEYADKLRHSDFRTRLFPNDLFSVPSDLILFFPDYDSYLRGQMTPQFALTVLFMLIIAFCFTYTIRTILRQKRFAARTVDFINNMTHEFKTPLSTVALACDALQRPDVAADETQVRRFSRMVRDENSRMRSQVDKILQMAVLEEKDYELTLADVDVHEVIRKAVTSMALHVEARGGSTTSRLDAEAHTILADDLHFENVIHNLLENANKYSPERPAIVVATENRDGGIVISIADQGIGIPEKEQKLVFAKYYRVSSGDIQDVRGFGIGLAYVKLMVEAMGGTVRLDSGPGRGTTVVLFFPLSPA